MKKATTLLVGFLFILSVSSQVTSKQKQKIDKAKVIAEQFLKDQKIPGMAISVSHKGGLIWSEGFGYADVENKKKATPNSTLFRIASISKTVTAVAMAKLVDDGKLDFNASLYRYVPDFPKKKFVFTVKQIAGHIAGIRHYNGNEFLMNQKMSIVKGLDIFKNDNLLFKPGQKFSYSTYGWNLLSVVVQNASKVDFNEYMNKHIFSPLQMKNTSLDFSDKEMPNRTLFYIKQNGNIKIAPKVSNEFKVAGGGFISTSEDLILIGNEIINPKIISKRVIKEMVTPLQTSSGKNTHYGIGIGVVKLKNNMLRYAHSGGGMGATTYLLMYPKKEIVIVILTNLSRVNIRKLVGELEGVFIEE
jgi:CubicO group peptidase (beta-lactamase class C family)